jgi:hypothetical protein
MRKVFLLTGFNNWGKTYLITELFKRKRFSKDELYLYNNSGHKFCVQSQSNDDLGRDRYENIIEERLRALSTVGKKPSHIFTAFCPTKEPNNDSSEIIKSLFGKDEVHILAIEYKWCLHAKLDITQIKNYYSNLKNVKVHVLSEKSPEKKKCKLDDLLKPLL